MKKVYFDYAASTPIHPIVRKSYETALMDVYANPSSKHCYGKQAEQYVLNEKEKIASSLNVSKDEIIFTSGATESNNLAIIGYIRALLKTRGKLHTMVSVVEHPSVLNCYKQLEKEGVEVYYIPVDMNGRVEIDVIKDNIQINTVLISIMHVNNEVGTVQPVEEIGEFLNLNYPNIKFHVDGVQGFGKIPIELKNIDLYVISGHKIGGPKGVGVLIKKANTILSPLFYGGEQESGLRPGTLNVPIIMAMGEAISLCKSRIKSNYLLELYTTLYSEINQLPFVKINSPKYPSGAPHIINFSLPNLPSAILLDLLERKGVVASSQSACSSINSKESRVLVEMGLEYELCMSSIRISICEDTNILDINFLIRVLKEAFAELMESYLLINK